MCLSVLVRILLVIVLLLAFTVQAKYISEKSPEYIQSLWDQYKTVTGSQKIPMRISQQCALYYKSCPQNYVEFLEQHVQKNAEPEGASSETHQDGKDFASKPSFADVECNNLRRHTVPHLQRRLEELRQGDVERTANNHFYCDRVTAAINKLLNIVWVQEWIAFIHLDNIKVVGMSSLALSLGIWIFYDDGKTEAVEKVLRRMEDFPFPKRPSVCIHQQKTELELFMYYEKLMQGTKERRVAKMRLCGCGLILLCFLYVFYQSYMTFQHHEPDHKSSWSLTNYLQYYLVPPWVPSLVLLTAIWFTKGPLLQWIKDSYLALKLFTDAPEIVVEAEQQHINRIVLLLEACRDDPICRQADTVPD